MRKCIIGMAGLVLGAAAFAGGDEVNLRFSTKENPDPKTLFRAGAEFGNSRGKWNVSLKNSRGHADKGRSFDFLMSNGKTAGFSGLISAMELTVNGISWRRLQLKPARVREFAAEGSRGVEAMFNFDGAPVRVRWSMRSGSPCLDCEVKPSAKGLTQVTNLEVRVAAIPSFLDCGHGKPTRFDKYRRQLKTNGRLLGPERSRTFAIDEGERVFIFEDADYDGSSADKGLGPCAVVAGTPVKGRISINDSWTTNIYFTPDPSKAFRFSLVEYPERNIPNAEFEKTVLSMKGNR